MAQTAEKRTVVMKARLRDRANRLIRLVRLDAPMLILANESKLVERAVLLMLDDRESAHAADIAWRDVEDERLRNGWCIQEGCESRATPGDDICPACLAALEAQAQMDELTEALYAGRAAQA